MQLLETYIYTVEVLRYNGTEYERSEGGQWTRIYGESREPVYMMERALEAAYQEMKARKAQPGKTEDPDAVLRP